MKKLLMILALFLTLSALILPAACAEGDAFAVLAGMENAEPVLARLQSVAEPLYVSAVAEDGTVITVCQGYREADHVFIAYTVVPGSTETAGKPAGGLQGPVDAYVGSAGGLELPGGGRAPVFIGAEYELEDGSAVGWKECEIPTQYLADARVFTLSVSPDHTLSFPDGPAARMNAGQGASDPLTFALNLPEPLSYLAGTSETDAYRAEARLARGAVTLRGTVRLVSAEQAEGLRLYAAGEDPGVSLIETWRLYRNGEPVYDAVPQAAAVATGEDEVTYELYWHCPDGLEGLSLVPVYGWGAENPEAEIPLE